MSVTITIPRSYPAYLPGARLLAILAYPPKSATDQRWHKAESDLCRATLAIVRELDPEGAREPQVVIPEHLLAPAEGLESRLEKIMAQHRLRMAAAHVAVPLFREEARLAQGGQPSTHRRLTLSQRIQKVTEQELGRDEWLARKSIENRRRFPLDEKNFANRSYRPSLPVLHLAVAVAVWIDRSQKFFRRNPDAVTEMTLRDMAGPQFHGFELLLRPDDVFGIMSDAQAYEALVPALPRAEPAPQVCLRPVPDA